MSAEEYVSGWFKQGTNMVNTLKLLGIISLGASLGAVTRWGLSLYCNLVFPLVPLGTLLANIIGGFLIGIAFSVFSYVPTVSPEWRLLVITGFLGALTTFSTFSLEVWILFQQQKLGWAFAVICLHFFGSLAALFCGVVVTGCFFKHIS